MKLPFGTCAAIAALGALLATAAAGCGGDGDGKARLLDTPGRPAIEIVSPRNGSRHEGGAVVVRVEVENFELSPRDFGGDPQLGEGHVRFSLNRVPDCVDSDKLERAEKSPLGSGRLIGRSFDYARYSGPNGSLAERIGSAGIYSPATAPEIYYEHLLPGFYRLIITLAQNDGTPAGTHDVTNFEILPDADEPVPERPECKEGQVSSADAAAQQ